MATVGIIGVGSVGSTVAYTLVMQKLCKFLYLYDNNKLKAQGEVEDLMDTGMDVVVQVWDLTDVMWSQVDVLVVTAGVKQSFKNRLDDLEPTKAILADIFSKVNLKASCKVILVSNPVDLVTGIAQKLLYGRLPRCAVFGSGCLLDTYRLCAILGERLGVRSRDVHAQVMGEHGESQFIPWSLAEVGGMPLTELLSVTERRQVEDLVRGRARSIIDKKGATFYGIARVVGDLVKSVLRDDLLIVPVSAWHADLDVCFSTLAVIGRHGVEKLLKVRLNPEEVLRLTRSAATLRRVLHEH